MSANYNDILCEAIGIVVDGKLNNITYDKTVICTIVDNSKKDEGYYTVTTEDNVKFDAISESNKYRIDDQVYVTIPQGDYSKQKIIISKYTAEDRNKPVRYASPLETVVPMTNNLMDVMDIKEVGIIANKDISKEVAVIDLTNKELEIDVQNNNIFNTLGISAKFKTLFGNKNVVSGNYGLYIVLDCTLLDGTTKVLDAEFDVDSNDMYGDVYNFTTYFTQEKKIDISNLSKIKTIKIWLREDSNFYYIDGNIRKKLPTTKFVSRKNAEGKIEQREESILPNIFVSDIQLFFGNDIVKIEDDTFSIYSNNPLKYSAEKVKEDPTYNTKDLYSIWYNKDNESSEFIGFTDGSPLLDENNNVIEYDEDEYQEELNTSMKGISTVVKPEDGNIPKLRQGLQIYANACDMNTQFQLLFQKINRELSYCISELDQLLKANQIKDIDSLIQEAKELISSTVGAIEACTTLDAEDLKASIQKKYISWLQYYGGFYDILKKDLTASIEKPEEIQELLDDIQTLYNYYISQWTNLKNKLAEIYEEQIMQVLYSKYSLMRYDFVKYNKTYEQRLETCQKYVNKIDTFQKNQETLCVELDSRLTNNNTNLRNIELFEIEYQKFVEKYKNKYCIYWYRYNPALLNGSTDDRYLGAPWERIDLKGYTTKPGMPTVLLDKTYSKKSEVGLTGLEMNCNIEAEKFKAVLFFNHQEYWSNELTFENESPIANATQSNALYIELGEHAADSFPLYGLNNELNPADSGRLRELRVRYNGLLEKDELLKNAWVYWYIPENSTMLICPESELLNKGFTYLDPDNTLYLEEHLPYRKDKFKCYFKQMGSEEVLNEESELVETVKTDDTKFYFQISKLYRSSAMNNTIYCRVVKEEDLYETSRQFSFGYFGTAGTQYTLSITPAEDSNQYALINVDDEPYPLELQARFSNYNNREVPDDEAPTISWGWIKPHKLTAGLDIIENDRGKNYRSISGTLSIGSPPQCLYNVLECTAKWQHISTDLETGTEHYADEPITLKAYYPVPFSSGHYYVDCPTTIVYNDIGKINTTNYNTKLKIYDSTTSAEIKNVIWKMNYYNFGGIAEEPEVSAANFLPVIKKVYSDTEAKYEYIFVAKETYISNPTLFPVAMCYHEDGSFLWAQPILLMQSAYGSNILNNWDEKLTIDEENGIILSTAIAAGTKDEQNRFHGVIMGYVDAITTEGNDLLTQSGISGFGLYGLNANAPSFGFTEDGTGFIGKSGSGRLIFDGENAEIKSQSRELTGDETHPYGMLLKFNEGVFDILGSQYSRITIQEDDPYLKIKSINGTVLMEVGDDDYYLQTDDFTNSGLTTPGCGFKLDLKNNRLTGYDFDLEAKSADGKSYIKLGIADGDEAYPYLKVHYTDDDAWGKDLLVIDKNQYFLQSHNYDTDKYTGLRFDLLNGSLNGYNFTLYSKNASNQYIQLSSNYFSDPITVYGGPAYVDGQQVNIGLFRVGWDGSMQCGGHFRIDKDGTMYSSRAYIGGWKVGPTSITAGGTTLGSNGTISNNGLTFASGKLTGGTIENATLGDLTITGTMTVGEGGLFKVSGASEFTGDVTINGGSLNLPSDQYIKIGTQDISEYVAENASLISLFSNNKNNKLTIFDLFGDSAASARLSDSKGAGLSAGSSSTPVYFSGGVPVACSTTFASTSHYHTVSGTVSVTINGSTITGPLSGKTSQAI